MVFRLPMLSFGVFSSPRSFGTAAPGGWFLFCSGSAGNFQILMRIWRLAWFLLRVPPSGRSAKRTLGVGGSYPTEKGCGLGIFFCLFLVQDTPFSPYPASPSPQGACLPLLPPGAASPASPAARTPRSLPSQEVPHRPRVP